MLYRAARRAKPVKATLASICDGPDWPAPCGDARIANHGIQSGANMSSMEINFYRALRAAKVSEALAQTAVESLEEAIAMKVKEANRSLEIRMNFLIALTVLSTALGGYIAYLKH